MDDYEIRAFELETEYFELSSHYRSTEYGTYLWDCIIYYRERSRTWRPATRGRVEMPKWKEKMYGGK